MAFGQLSHRDLSWCVRRLPKKVFDLMKQHGPNLTLAGGFIRSVIASEKVNDIDLFTSSSEAARSFAWELNGDPRDFHPTDNAFSVRVGNGLSVQFIHRWTFDKPQDVVPSFDFTIARAALWFESGVWSSLIDERFYPDLAAKRLVYCNPVRNEDAGGSLLRVLKFYQRGYRVPLDSLGAVMARLVNALDFEAVSKPSYDREQQIAKVLTGLLREVDPNIDTEAYEPAPEGE